MSAAKEEKAENGAFGELDDRHELDLGRVVANNESMNILEYLKSLSGQGAIRVKVHRTWPKIWKGKHIEGLLETLEEPISEEEIQSRWGGGKFRVQVERQTGRGNQYVHAGSKTITIAGDPRLDNMQFGNGDSGNVAPLIFSGEDSTLQKAAMTAMADTAHQERERADRLEAEVRDIMKDQLRGSGLDPTMIRLILEPVQQAAHAAEVRAADAQRQAAEDRRTFLEAMNKPPGQTSQDKLLEVIVQRSVTEGEQRISALREAHAAEIRTIKENHREDVKRAEDRADRMLDQASRAHDRELSTLKAAHDSEINALRSSHEARHAVLEGENKRLLRELEEKKAEIAEIRAKKDKSPTDTILELSQLKEALGSLGGNDDADPPSTFEKFVDKVGPILEGVGQRIAAGPPQPQPMVAPQRMPVKRRPIAPQAGAKAPTPVPQVAAPRPVPVVEVPAAQLKMAIEYVEGAIQARQDPEIFARSIQSQLDAGIIQAIKSAGGFDKFLEGRVQLGVNSPLSTQSGRNFLRKVEKVLIGDTPSDD